MAIKSIDIPEETLEALWKLCDITLGKRVSGSRSRNEDLALLLQDSLRVLEVIVRDQTKGKTIASLTGDDMKLLSHVTVTGQNVSPENSYAFASLITPGKEEAAKAYFESVIKIKTSER